MLVRFIASCLYVVFVYLLQESAILSSLVGVIACFVPESFQAWKVSKIENIYDPTKWLRLTYQSVISKWLMTAMIFAISFSSATVWDYRILFIGYLFVSISGLLTPILIKGNR